MNDNRPHIIGGGPAGASAAIQLAEAGVRPIVYERNTVPHDALCGGFVSWTTLARLERLGIARETLRGHPVHRLRLVVAGRVIERTLPAGAMGLSRRRLDALLLDRAKAAGAELRHASVRFADGAFCLPDGTRLGCEPVFLATGKYEMRGLPRRQGRDDAWLGLRLRLVPSARVRSVLAGHVEIHAFAGGYAGLVLQEDGRANLCFALQKDRLRAAGGDPKALLSELAATLPLLGERMSENLPDAGMDAVGNVPFGWSRSRGTAGVFALGDQAGVIPSLAGEGIGVAVASARMAVDAWLRHGSSGSGAYQRGLARRLMPRLAVAGFIARAATDSGRHGLLAGLARLPRAARVVSHATRL